VGGETRTLHVAAVTRRVRLLRSSEAAAPDDPSGYDGLELQAAASAKAVPAQMALDLSSGKLPPPEWLLFVRLDPKDRSQEASAEVVVLRDGGPPTKRQVSLQAPQEGTVDARFLLVFGPDPWPEDRTFAGVTVVEVSEPGGGHAPQVGVKALGKERRRDLPLESNLGETTYEGRWGAATLDPASSGLAALDLRARGEAPPRKVVVELIEVGDVFAGDTLERDRWFLRVPGAFEPEGDGYRFVADADAGPTQRRRDPGFDPPRPSGFGLSLGGVEVYPRLPVHGEAGWWEVAFRVCEAKKDELPELHRGSTCLTVRTPAPRRLFYVGSLEGSAVEVTPERVEDLAAGERAGIPRLLLDALQISLQISLSDKVLEPELQFVDRFLGWKAAAAGKGAHDVYLVALPEEEGFNPVMTVPNASLLTEDPRAGRFRFSADSYRQSGLQAQLEPKGVEGEGEGASEPKGVEGEGEGATGRLRDTSQDGDGTGEPAAGREGFSLNFRRLSGVDVSPTAPWCGKHDANHRSYSFVVLSRNQLRGEGHECYYPKLDECGSVRVLAYYLGHELGAHVHHRDQGVIGNHDHSVGGYAWKAPPKTDDEVELKEKHPDTYGKLEADLVKALAVKALASGD
jgi:hypothetical protein